MQSFSTCYGSALQIPHMLRATGWKKPNNLKINLTLFQDTWIFYYLSTSLKHFISYFSLVSTTKTPVSLLQVSLVLSISATLYILFPRILKCFLFIHWGLVLFTFFPVTEWQNRWILPEPGRCLWRPLSPPSCSKQSQLEPSSTPCLGFLLSGKGEKCKHERLCAQLT